MTRNKNRTGPDSQEKQMARGPIKDKAVRIKHVKGCPNLKLDSNRPWVPCKNCR